MKKFLLVLVLSSCMVPVLARGAMSGEQDLRVIKTEWFDIIFPARSEPQAQRLASQADSIYQKIAQDYGMAPQFRLPVVITPAVEQHNGYFSQAFYNHIVLYDAPPSTDMDIFSDSLFSTFTHELTHAYTYNMKNGFWKGVGTIFGDTVNPGHLLITRGWAEGATLTMESSRGEGRMNSGYSLQMVRQAAIEDKFPAYADVQGARDTYPAGSFYNFNGGFNQWLQDTYGMEKYARFWYNCINLKALTAGWAFKKTYGISLNGAWKEFQRQVQQEWSRIPPQPLKEADESEPPAASDFFEPAIPEFSSRNRAGALYSSLVVSHRWLAWIDRATSTIYRSPLPVTEPDSGPQVQRVATFQGIQDIRLSQDGRFLVATVLSQNSAAAKMQLWLLDFDTNRWQQLSSSGRENGMVVRSEPGDGYLLLSTEYKNGATCIHIQRLLEDGRSFRLEHRYQGDFQEHTQYRDIVDLGGGRIAFIKSHGGRQQLVLAQLNATDGKEPPLQVLEELDLEDFIRVAGLETSSGVETSSGSEASSGVGLSIRNLSASPRGDQLLFSWATKDTLPRLGVLELHPEQSVGQGTSGSTVGRLSLQTTDISGGVHFPVSLPAGEAAQGDHQLAFIGTFYLENRLLTSSPSRLAMEASLPPQEREESYQRDAAPQPAEYAMETASERSRQETAPLPSSSYNPLRYHGRGVFLPLALGLATPHYGSTRDPMALPLGVTWMTSNPWLMGVMTASLGYGVDSRSVAYSLSYQNGTDTSLFQYRLEHGSEFDVTGAGWLHSTVTAEGTTSLPLGRISRLSLGNITRLQFGQELLEQKAATGQQNPAVIATGTPYLHLINATTASWSCIQHWGPGIHERLGISLGTEVYYTMNTTLSTRQLNMSAGNIGLSASIFIPKLLPLRTVQNHTYNLPTTITAAVFPSGLATGTESSLLSYSWGRTPSMAAMVEAKTILYSINIQKALPVVTAVYINDFDLSLRASVGFEDRLYLSDKDVASGNVVIPRGDDSWRLFRLNKYFSQLGSQQVPVVANIALRASLGLTPNVGFSAYPLLGGSLYVEFTTAGLTRPFAPVFRLGLTSRW